ncbi:hypothetical protein DSO57_1025739 [Entomophthora muscae]|uniref:Uncharacterized protein n=1 Tax=Entomophthora muscae TaxID=34485 RepID=A0ACC2RGW6_9FUNG|nr:hypothetical protein DSO57_1025739 [Entomophthora muscae]
MALEEKLATFCKETEEALLLASQTPAAQSTTTVVPEMDEIQCQLDSLNISNKNTFQEINKVNERHNQQQAALQAKICDLHNTVREVHDNATTQEFTLEEYREGMVRCGTLIDCLCRAMRELEAQMAEVRSEVQEGRCCCDQAQFSALCVSHDVSGESTTLRQPTSSAYKDDAISSSSGRQRLPPVFVVPLTPEETPCPNCSESSAGASWQNFFAHAQQDTPPPPRHQNTEENLPRFKLMNLPKFDPKGNVHTFIRLFEMSMYGANNQDKATTLLNQLDAASTDLIIPHMPHNDWSYATAKQDLLYEFGSITRVMEQKNEFLMIQF